MVVTLRELTDDNRAAVLELRVAPQQERFVGGSVQDALDDAWEYRHAKPWYRVIYADDEPVGFVMVSWDVEPQPPVPQDGGPAGFYRRLGFAPTGELDANGEVIVRLLLA
jgi:diamine N-acetyltransferase